MEHMTNHPMIHGRRSRKERCPMSISARRDRGFGLIEALATIAILAALTAGAIIAVPRLLNRGQDSAASASLTTAVTEVREVYSRVTSSGGTNFTGGTIPTGTTDADDLTVLAVKALNASESSLCYYPLTSGTSTATTTALTGGTAPTGCAGPLTGGGMTGASLALDTGAVTNAADRGKVGADLIRSKGTSGIWVLVSAGETWTSPAGTIRAGQAIRIGTVSESGATYCALLVADHTAQGETGTVYEARSEATSNNAAAGDTLGWADCGARLVSTGRGAESVNTAHMSSTVPTPS